MTGFHATTARVAQYCADGDELRPGGPQERFAHLFVFDALEHALAFVARYPGNFRDTGPAILELDLAGVALEPDPGRPPLPGAWRTAETIGPERLIALHEPADGGWERIALRD